MIFVLIASVLMSSLSAEGAVTANQAVSGVALLKQVDDLIQATVAAGSKVTIYADSESDAEITIYVGESHETHDVRLKTYAVIKSTGDIFEVDMASDARAPVGNVFDKADKANTAGKAAKVEGAAQQGDAPEPGANVDPASQRQPPRPGDR